MSQSINAKLWKCAVRARGVCALESSSLPMYLIASACLVTLLICHACCTMIFHVRSVLVPFPDPKSLCGDESGNETRSVSNIVGIGHHVMGSMGVVVPLFIPLFQSTPLNKDTLHQCST